MSDREHALRLLHGAAAAIEQSRGRLDDLNVYPVPDGDTGTNLALTVRAVVEAVETSAAADRAGLARDAARAALMGARGNSGVILSQIVRGAAEALADEAALDSGAIARAFRGGADAAYRAVRQPVEGTMLTVVRSVAEAAEAERELQPTALLQTLVRAGEEAVARTREQLDVLREAAVVDAGGAGLVELVRGIAAAAADEPLPQPALTSVEEPEPHPVHQEPSRYRYCTTFVIEGQLDPGEIERRLEELGDSLLVVGDAQAVKAHVHTDDPGAALTIGTAAGAIAQVEIADMHRQIEARERRLLAAVPDAEAARSAAVAVVVGDGNRRLFESLGATELVDGGETMNPPTSDLLAAIERAGAPEVVVLPNDENVVLAAEQAARLSGKAVSVVPSESLPAGLAVLVAFDPARSAADNAAEMRDGLARVATGAVTRASRAVQLNAGKLERGGYLGLVGGEPVAGDDEFGVVAESVARALLAEPRAVLTLLTGEDQPPLGSLVETLEAENPELEIEVHEGGQPLYPLLIAAE